MKNEFHKFHWLFRLAPFLVFDSTVATTMLITLTAVPRPFDPAGDLLLVVYLLLISAFSPLLAGLHPGTAFERGR